MAVPPRRRQPEVVGATPHDGEGGAVVGLHVEDLDHVGAERRDQVPAAFEPEPDGRSTERPAEAGPVEGPLEGGVVDADATAGVHDPDPEPGGGGPAGGPLHVAGDEPGVGRSVVVVGETVEVEAGEAQVRAAPQEIAGGGDVALVDPELRRLPGHGQGRHRQRAGQVDPQGHRQRRCEPRGDVLRPVQLVEALHVDRHHPRASRGGEGGIGLGRPAEDDRRAGRRRPHQGDLPGRAHLEAGHDPGQGLDDRPFGVGLQGVEQLTAVGQRGHRRGGVRPESGEVVDVGAHRPVAAGPELGDHGRVGISAHRRG